MLKTPKDKPGMSLSPTGRAVKRPATPFLSPPLPPPGPLLVGVSGGADSVALLLLLHSAAPDHGWHITVGHVDHALRPDSADDAAWVADLAASLGLECRISRVRVQLAAGSPEEAARDARRQALKEMASACRAQTIALAHTADDQAETVLARALIGSGPTGLSGMRARRGLWWRPLLSQRRDDLRRWLADRGQTWREDPSNADHGPQRNRLRNLVLPLIRERINPRAEEALCRLAGILAREEDFWDRWCRRAADELFTCQGDSLLVRDPGDEPLHPAQGLRLLRLAASAVTGRGQHLLHEQLLGLWELWTGRPGREAHPGAGLWAAREPGGLRLAPRGPAPAFGGELAAPGILPLPHLGLDLQAEYTGPPPELKAHGPVAWLPAEAVAWPLIVRPPQTGDRLQPLGAPGSKPLRRIFTDRKIPAWWRTRSPVVADAGGIWWAAPWAVSQRVRQNPHTKRYLRLSLVDRGDAPPYTW